MCFRSNGKLLEVFKQGVLRLALHLGKILTDAVWGLDGKRIELDPKEAATTIIQVRDKGSLDSGGGTEGGKKWVDLEIYRK